MDLSSRIQQFFQKKKPLQAVGNFGANLAKNAVASWNKTPIQQGINNAQDFVFSPKSFGLPQVPKQINPTLQVGIPMTKLQIPVKPVSIARDIVNTPFSWTLNTLSDAGQNIGRSISGQPLAPHSNLKSPVTKLGYQAGSLLNPTTKQLYGIKESPQELLANIGGSAAGPLSVYSGGKILGSAGKILPNAGRRTLGTLLKPELIKSVQAGGAFGIASGLEEGRNMSLPGQLANAGVQGVANATLSALATGGIGSAGYAVGKMKSNLLAILGNKGIRGAEAERVLQQFARDEMGRFTGKKAEPKTPIGLFNNMLEKRTAVKNEELYGELRRALFLPDDYQSGFIKPSEFLPKNLRNTGQRSYTNVPELDNPLLPKNRTNFVPSSEWQEVPFGTKVPIGGEFKLENGKQFGRWIKDETTKESTKGVLGEIISGFDAGRQARDATPSNESLGLKARTELIDRFSPVYDFEKQGGKLPADVSPYKQIRLLAGNSGRAEAFLNEKVAPILRNNRDTQQDLSALLVLDRERELIGQGKIRKRTIGEVYQGISELQAKYGSEGSAKLQEGAGQVRQVFKDLKQQLVDAGIISKESSDAMDQKGQYYTAFEAVSHMADQMEKDFGTGSVNVSTQDVIKRIGDYTGDVADPLETLVRKIPKVINLVEKNKAITSLVNLRKVNPEIYGDIIKPVTGAVPDGMGVVNVFENGRNVKYTVPSVVERAIKNLDAETGGILVTLGSIQAKLLRAGATGLNIGFIPVNIIRDIQDSLTTEVSENGVKAMLQFLGSYPRAIFAAARRDDLYQQWAKSGGLQSTMTEQIFKSTPKSIAELSGRKAPLKTRLNPIMGVKGLVEFANRVGEQSTRLARFQSGLKRGESLSEAAFKSRDISLDFAKAGNSIKVLNQVIPFLNASIQGSEKLMRLYKTNPKAAIAATGVMFGVPTVALFTHNSQFKDYDDIPNSEKQTNWIILARDRTEEEIANGQSPIGIKIPKGFMARMTSSVTESAMDFMKKGDPSTFATTGLDIASSLSPIGVPYNQEQLGKTLSTILPPWIKAGVEYSTNKNLFFGSDIVPQGLQNLPASEQYKEKTPGIYKQAGRLGLSPLKVENTVNTISGGLGRQLATGFSGDVKGGTIEQVSRRFMDIRDGKKTEEAYQAVNKEKEYTALRNKQLKEAFQAGDMEEVKRLSQGMSSQQINSLIRNDFKKQQQKELTPEQRAYGTLSKEERARMLKDRPELKTEFDIVQKAGAAEKTPYDFGEQLASDAEEAGIKLEVETSGKPQEFNNNYYYVNDEGNVSKVSMDFSVTPPDLIGETKIDKELIKDYQSEITTKQNNVTKLYKLGKLSKTEAALEFQKLEDARSTSKGGGGGGKKGSKSLKVDFRQFANMIKPTPIKARVVKSQKSKIPQTRSQVIHPQIKELKFKGKPLRIKR